MLYNLYLKISTALDKRKLIKNVKSLYQKGGTKDIRDIF